MVQRPKAAPEKGARNAYREAFQQGTQAKSSLESLEICAELEAGVEALRIHYEQYFLGLSRLPPREEHDLVRAAVLRLRQSFVRNTAARFRVQSLHNRFLAYERMWQRTSREIEEGTYRRDLFKARLRGKLPTGPASEDATKAKAGIDALKERMQQPIEDHDVDLSDDSSGPANAVAPASVVGRMTRSPAVAPPPQASRQPTRSPEGLPDEKLRALYDAYVTAKKRCRESTEGLTLESLSNNLRKQVPELLASHKASAIDFKVVIKGGKASLKAVPR